MKDNNTVIMPDATARVSSDVAQINQGQGWIREGNNFRSSSGNVKRIYVIVSTNRNLPPELSPQDDGDIDFFPMERGAYRALTILKKFKAGESPDNMDRAMNEINQNLGISNSNAQRALFVYDLGRERGGNP